jgi:hypothetical protein
VKVGSPVIMIDLFFCCGIVCDGTLEEVSSLFGINHREFLAAAMSFENGVQFYIF